MVADNGGMGVEAGAGGGLIADDVGEAVPFAQPLNMNNANDSLMNGLIRV
jgi:hypothetical protein